MGTSFDVGGVSSSQSMNNLLLKFPSSASERKRTPLPVTALRRTRAVPTAISSPIVADPIVTYYSTDPMRQKVLRLGTMDWMAALRCMRCFHDPPGRYECTVAD